MCLGQRETGRTIVKPASFKTQEFRSIVLDNAIEFLLVSDAELDKAGASIDVRILLFRLLQRIVTSSPNARARLFDMSYLELDNMQSSMPSDLHMRSCCVPQVRVGSLSDPRDTPGLAHFCEHMLFYASAKYPEEDAYSKYVVSHASGITKDSLGCLHIAGRPQQLP